MDITFIKFHGSLGKDSTSARCIPRGAVATNCALSKRHGADGPNPAAGGKASRGAVSTDGTLIEGETTVGFRDERADRSTAKRRVCGARVIAGRPAARERKAP